MHFHVMFTDLGSEFVHQDNAYAHAAASTYLEIDPIEFDFSWSSAIQPRSCSGGIRRITSHKSQSKKVKFDGRFWWFEICNSHNRIDSCGYASVFDAWLKRCEKCIQ